LSTPMARVLSTKPRNRLRMWFQSIRNTIREPPVVSRRCGFGKVAIDRAVVNQTSEPNPACGDRATLERLLADGKTPQKIVARARIVLLSGRGASGRIPSSARLGCRGRRFGAGSKPT
jgi:hypothetical protein